MRTANRTRSRAAPWRVVVALSVALAASSGCREATEEPVARNVLLIVVDTLRADRLGAYGHVRPTSPAIDALARSGTRFDRAYATAPWTMPSVASMLTGLQPGEHGVTRLGVALSPEATTIAGVLSDRGYATSAVVSHHLIGRQYGFDRGFQAFDQSESKSHDHLSTNGVTAAAVAQLEEIAASGQPFFLFVHYFDPHYTYMPHPAYGWSSPAGRLKGGESMRLVRKLPAPLQRDEVRFLSDAYDEEIRFTDEGIGRLLAALDASGLSDTTVVAFTADHGEELYERGWIGHTRHLYEELIRVPLVVRLPGGQGAGQVVREPVSLVSLAPTLLEAVGTPPATLAGSGPSLLPRIRGGASMSDGAAAPVFAEVEYDRKAPRGGFADRRSANMRALVGPRFKLVHDRYTDAYELYDLIEDSAERHDLAAQRPDQVASMRADLDERSRAIASRADALGGGAGREVDLEEAELKRLESLGYVDR